MADDATRTDASPHHAEGEGAKAVPPILELIDRGVKTARGIHIAIANLPLDALEQVKVLESSAKQVKRAQEITIGSVYDVIGGINRQVAEFLGHALPPRR